MKNLIEEIDAVLPQTQCGLCGYKGCKPYAKALAEQTAEINLCPPGGIKGLLNLAQIMNQDSAPYFQEMKQKAKPPMYAFIREAECIGCTKCIQACPVDAIVGAGKLMHTVIKDECTGCELCVAPCPVDCIDMVPNPELQLESKRELYRQRFNARENRLAKVQHSTNQSSNSTTPQKSADRKAYIEAAVLRAKLKKQAVSVK